MNLFPADLANAVADRVRAEVAAWPSKCLAAYVAGSRVDGLGNAGSDVDVYVITDDESYGDEIHRAVNGVQVEITFVSRRKVDEALRAFCSRELDAAGGARIDLYSALLCHRFLARVDLFGSGVLEHMSAGASRGALSTNLRKFYQGHAADTFKDAVGAYLAEEYATAALAAPRACSYAIDMYLAASGDTNPLAKWRFKRLAACSDVTAADISKSFGQVLLPLNLPNVRTEREYVLFAATLFQWLHDLLAQRAHGIVAPQSVSGRSLCKDPLSYLSLVDDTTFLIGRDSGFRVSRQFIEAWLVAAPLPTCAVSRFVATEAAPIPQTDDIHPDLPFAMLRAAGIRVLLC